MIRTFLPAVVGLIAILSLSLYENIYMKDRWGEAGAEASVLGKRFAQVPKEIGDWSGEDLPVEVQIQKTAGAVNYVSRKYTNTSTREVVTLWLIVGHSRNIVRHQPTECYPSSGFRQDGPTLEHEINIGNEGKKAVFYTAKFEKENSTSKANERVFWTFNHPEMDRWEAPEKGARTHYGLAKALYKLYFTSNARRDETIEESPASEFAALMLPEIDAALFPTEEADTSEASEFVDPTEELLNSTEAASISS